jgi:hypothetical protein
MLEKYCLEIFEKVNYDKNYISTYLKTKKIELMEELF